MPNLYTYKIYWSKGINADVANIPPSTFLFKTSRVDFDFTVPSVAPQAAGYTFTGWQPSIAGHAIVQPGGTLHIQAYTSYVQMTAKWQKQEYTVSFNANGGSGAPGQRTTEDQKLRLPSTKPTKEHYAFLGWATSSSATTPQYAPGHTYTFTSNRTLYAVWSCKLTMPVLTTGSGRFLYPTQQATITMTPSINTNTHKLQVLFNDQTITIGSNLGTSKTYTPPTSWAQYITDANSCAGTLRCYTYLADGTELGYEEIPIIIDLHTLMSYNGFTPKITGVTQRDAVLWADDNFVETFNYIFVLGKTVPIVSWSITPSNYYATVKSLKIISEGKTYQIDNPAATPASYRLPVITTSSQVKLVLTDSRGNQDTYTQSYAKTRKYHVPRIALTTSPQRSDTTNTDVEFSYSWDISPLENTSDVASNIKTIKIYLRKHGSGSYTLKATITPDTYTGTADYVLQNVDTEYQYDIKIEAIDYFGTTTVEAFVPALGDVTLDFAYSDGTIAAHGFSPADGKDHWYSKEMVFEKRISAAGKKLVYIAGDEISVGIRCMAFPVGATADGKYQMDVPIGAQIDGNTTIKSGTISIYKYDGTAIFENKTAKDISATSISTGQCVIEATPMANGIVRCFMQFRDQSHPAGMNLHTACPVFGNLVLKVVAS